MRVKLSDIYKDGELDDEEEMIYHFAPEDGEYESFVIPHEDLTGLLAQDGVTPLLESFRNNADADQKSLVRWKADNFDEARVVVLSGKVVIDGQHHMVAAHRKKRPVTAIDLESPAPEEPSP